MNRKNFFEAFGPACEHSKKLFLAYSTPAKAEINTSAMSGEFDVASATGSSKTKRKLDCPDSPLAYKGEFSKQIKFVCYTVNFRPLQPG